MSTNSKINVIYIAGYGRSGSTLLDIKMGQYFNILSLGECFYFYKHKNLLKCSCKQSNLNCDFWKDINSEDYFESLKLKLNITKNIWFIDSSKTTRARILFPYKYKKHKYNVHIILLKRRIEDVINSKLNFRKRNNIKTNYFILVIKTLFSFCLTHIFTTFLYKYLIKSKSFTIYKYEDLLQNTYPSLNIKSLRNENSKHLIGGNRIRFYEKLEISNNHIQNKSQNLIFRTINYLNGYR